MDYCEKIINQVDYNLFYRMHLMYLLHLIFFFGIFPYPNKYDKFALSR